MTLVVEGQRRRPPLDPDTEAARTIKGLRTQVRNLNARWQASIAKRDATPYACPPHIYKALAKVLHPDTAAHSTAEARAKALALIPRPQPD